MKLAAEQLHGAEEITAGMRGVLFSLDRSGPQTVPQMARARPVSRQHIQMLINPLVERRCVERVDNPAHKRSSLVKLTPKGRRLVERMRNRETYRWSTARPGVRLRVSWASTAGLLEVLQSV